MTNHERINAELATLSMAVNSLRLGGSLTPDGEEMLGRASEYLDDARNEVSHD